MGSFVGVGSFLVDRLRLSGQGHQGGGQGGLLHSHLSIHRAHNLAHQRTLLGGSLRGNQVSCLDSYLEVPYVTLLPFYSGPSSSPTGKSCWTPLCGARRPSRCSSPSRSPGAVSSCSAPTTSSGPRCTTTRWPSAASTSSPASSPASSSSPCSESSSSNWDWTALR